MSSVAFRTSSEPGEGMSVDIERFIREEGKDPFECVRTPRWIGAIQIAVGSARDAELLVGYDPLRENPYHGQVRGKAGAKFSKAQERVLRASSRWFIELEGVQIQD